MGQKCEKGFLGAEGVLLASMRVTVVLSEGRRGIRWLGHKLKTPLHTHTHTATPIPAHPPFWALEPLKDTWVTNKIRERVLGGLMVGGNWPNWGREEKELLQ